MRGDSVPYPAPRVAKGCAPGPLGRSCQVENAVHTKAGRAEFQFQSCSRFAKRPLANHRRRVLAPGLAGHDLLRPNTKSVTPLENTRSVQDTEGRDVELRYFRDVDGHEVDFVVVEGRQPAHVIACKWADATIDRGHGYLTPSFAAPAAWKLPRIEHESY